ncbi:MAG: glycosyltransferase [Fidelibacterota bacterium]|nr:MAG: glycosyltransferase [Candidatus Neomarinimicrobiota bacterium]
MMARGTLSVCMIVRNESRMLPDCLSSIQDVADQLVIVDTGSTDDTVSIASSFGAQIHHFKWIDDFAAARNESIRHATGDWILWLDADEQLMPASVEPLKRLLVPPKRPTIYQVMIRNLQADKQSSSLSMSHRLFSRHPRLRFSGRIHEQIHPSLKVAGGVEKPSDVILEHEGYALDEDQMRTKLERNQVLLDAMIEEQPDSAYAHYTLGQNYALLGRQEQALKAYLRALEINAFTGTSVSTLLNALAETCWQLDRLDEAETYARKSLGVTRRQTSGNFIMYRIMRSRGDVEGQVEYLERVLAFSQQGEGIPRGDLRKDIIIPRQHVLFSLGQLYLSIGNDAAAEKALKECLELKPDHRETLEMLIPVLAKQNRWEELLTVLDDLSRPLPDNIREMGGMALIKLKRFEEAITYHRAWLEDTPDHEGLRKRLAGLYAKVGDRQAAQRILEGKPPD